MLASGALEDASGTAKDDIQVQLDRMSSSASVDAELARMKAALPSGSARPAELTAGGSFREEGRR